MPRIGGEVWVFPSLDKARQYLQKFRNMSSKPHFEPDETRRAAIEKLEEIERLVQSYIHFIQDGDSLEPRRPSEPRPGRLKPRGFERGEVDAEEGSLARGGTSTARVRGRKERRLALTGRVPQGGAGAKIAAHIGRPTSRNVGVGKRLERAHTGYREQLLAALPPRPS